MRESKQGAVAGRGMRRWAAGLVAAGGGLSLLALATGAGPERLGAAYLLGFVFCWTIVLGSLFFVALQHVTRSVWSVVLRRAAEMLAAPMWLLALLFLPLAACALFPEQVGLFPWLDRTGVRGSHLLEGKAPYLNAPFFVARAALFFLLWGGFARFFVGRSLAQDSGAKGEALGATLRMRRLSAPFLVVFGISATFASFDWLMSLEPAWFSTIFGVYVFSGMALASLAAITIAVLGMRARGLLGDGIVTGHHLYSLGGLLFAFTCFWAYIAFSQFMLIWYGNLPEETVYFVRRARGGWLGVSVLLAVLRFAVPFLLLLARGAKTSPRRLALVSGIVLAGELLDLHWMIMPAVSRSGPGFAWHELGPPLLLAGILLGSLARFLRRHRPMAVGDPWFEKSCRFHL